MEEKYDIQNLLHKFILNECEEEELKYVITYFQNSKKSDAIPSVEEVLELIDFAPEMEVIDANRIHDTIIEISRIKELKSRKKYVLKYAISIAAMFLLSLGYFFNEDLYIFFLNENSKELIMDKENITLKLEDGSIKIIKEDGGVEVVDASGNIIGKQEGEQLAYNGDSEADVLVYNELNVPYGKKFNLKLSDGTLVVLNSGTSLKFPVKFIKGKKREVFISGEAFFDVHSDKEHPFIVNAEDLNVEVLGTKFNVSAYPEDNNIDVVLVEGGVSLYDEGIESYRNKITPNTKGTYNKSLKNITTERVNISIYTGWMKGVLVFRNMSFNNILKKLERNYNVQIKNNNKRLSKEVFNASFNNENISKVLSYFVETSGITYKISEEDNSKIIEVN